MLVCKDAVLLLTMNVIIFEFKDGGKRYEKSEDKNATFDKCDFGVDVEWYLLC